ncbi:eukaryotic translation initiation factor 3 subunit J-A-like [Acanthaster planci]|uniref:Eukaryotic translation initiation factor 3 subunit J n=1 Tax=Acanthaster planci TaxID=133434 RepID=A0A8B7ZXN7_ACAPL|nr:eukaryotic translation initiation factor 3 subunit J-A-like [Acanthaster planci]
MADWDSEDFDPDQGFAKPVASDRWEGEDEEEVKGTWDESDEEKKEEDKPQEVVKAIQVKKKKSLEATLKAKEEKRKKQLEEKKQKEQEQVELSQEEILAEKLRQQKLQEDSDLELAKEAFGVTDDIKGRIDAMQPQTAEEFEEFAKLLKEKLQQLEKSQHYVDMLDNVFQGCSLSLEADQVKRLGANLTAISNEKAKALKASKSKKKGKKAALAGSGKAGKGLDDYEDAGYDDMDDFI